MKVKLTRRFVYNGATYRPGETAVVDGKVGLALLREKSAVAVAPEVPEHERAVRAPGERRADDGRRGRRPHTDGSKSRGKAAKQTAKGRAPKQRGGGVGVS